MSPPTFDPVRAPHVTFVDYVRVMYRHRWIAAATFLAVVIGTGVYTYWAIPVYQAQVSILIDLDEPNVVQFPKVLNEAASNAGSPQTQHELLRSRVLAQRTVAALQLWKRPEFGVSSEDAAVGAVRAGLQVMPIRGTRMVNLVFRWSDPKLATEIVNTHAHQYIEQSLEKRFLASKEATEWLDTQLVGEQRRVQEAESALQAYREQHDSVSLDQAQNIVIQRLADLSAALTRAKTNRLEKETQYRELVAAQRDPTSLDAFPAILANSFIQQLKAEVATQRRDYAQMAETLGALHPLMVEKRTALQIAEEGLAAEIARVVESGSNAYRAALTDEQSLTKALDEQKRESLSLSRRGIEYGALQRKAESVRLVYQSLLQRAKETSVSRELRATNVQIIDLAQPPRQPVFPRPMLNLLLSLVAGSLLAIGLVFMLEIADHRIRLPNDATRDLGQPVLGFVPEVRSKDRKRVSLTWRGAPGVLVESFRILRTSIIAAMPGNGPRSILVVSTAQNEGKTYIATNLAVALAQAQHRVLLMDADMRRPSAHEALDGRLEPGLSNVLNGTVALSDALQQGSIPGLKILSGGHPSDRAPELLGSPVFEQLLNVLEEHFEWVIIDSPPTLSVTDASIVARHAAGVLFVIGCAMTRSEAARAALDELQRVGCRVLGTVLNRADVTRHPFYFGRYWSAEYFSSLGSPGRRVQAIESTITGKG